MIQLLFLFCFYSSVAAQCYEDSDISLQHDRNVEHYQEYNRGGPQCVGNYSVFSETNIDDNAAKGIRCSRKGSNSMNGYWETQDGVVIQCGVNTDSNGVIARCERGSGYVTLYTPSGLYIEPPANFTCCIDGLCATIRLLAYLDFQDFFSGQSDLAQLETCIIVPPYDITTIPQQYLVQMNTSVIPFSRISSLINCTDGDGITCGQSYYTLIDLNEERYQMTVPVTWSIDSTTNTDHYYSCRVRYGGLQQDDNDGVTINSKTKTTSIKASSAPSSVRYEVVNTTAISISWSISGDVKGFIINITSDGLNTATIQLTDGLLREYMINGFLLNRNYTVDVRGYYELLGPAKTTTVRIQYGVNTINGSLLSVSDDLSIQTIQVNCYTFGVTQDHLIFWTINSVLITPDSSYEPVNGSVLLDSTHQTYRHYITLKGSFTDETTISCNANVNGESISKDYTLRAPSSPPTGLSATIMSFTSLSISWTSLSDVNGYIIQYTGGQPVMINGKDSSNSILEGLTQGTTYQINIYSYSDLLSTTYTNISALVDVPLLISFDVHLFNPTSTHLTWSLSDSSIVDSYSLSITRVCDNTKTHDVTFDSCSLTSITISMLSSGFQYTAVVVPVNILGKGIEKNNTVTLEETIPPSVAPLLQSPETINSTAIKLTWDEVNCFYSNGIITGYRVMYRNEVQQSTIINVTDDTTSTVITGLIDLQLYYFSVSAINSIGAGPYSEEKKAYTTVNELSALSLEPDHVLAGSSVLLSWNEELGSVGSCNCKTIYEVGYRTTAIGTSSCGHLSDILLLQSFERGYTSYVNTTDSSVKVAGLRPGRCYLFGVRISGPLLDWEYVTAITERVCRPQCGLE